MAVQAGSGCSLTRRFFGGAHYEGAARACMHASGLGAARSKRCQRRWQKSRHARHRRRPARGVRCAGQTAELIRWSRDERGRAGARATGQGRDSHGRARRAARAVPKRGSSGLGRVPLHRDRAGVHAVPAAIGAAKGADQARSDLGSEARLKRDPGHRTHGVRCVWRGPVLWWGAPDGIYRTNRTNGTGGQSALVRKRP